MGIKQQAEKFGLGSFDLKLFRLEKIDGKAENFAIVTKAQLNMELPFPEFVEGTGYETRQTSKRDLFVRVLT